MTLFNNPLAPKKNGLRAKSADIKGWVRELMDLSDETTLTVAELACREPGCPDIETVIGILEPDKPIRTVRIHAPMADVTKTDVGDSVGTLTQVEKH